MRPDDKAIADLQGNENTTYVHKTKQVTYLSTDHSEQDSPPCEAKADSPIRNARAGPLEIPQERVRALAAGHGCVFAASLGDAEPTAAAAASAANLPRLQSQLAQAAFQGSEWQRPVRGGEVELLLQLAYYVALLIDRALGRMPRAVANGGGQVPQTEWPRMFADWRCTAVVSVLLAVVVW